MTRGLIQILKILFAIEFILILTIIALSFAEKQKITAYAVKENTSMGKANFNILTKAVCEKKSGHTFCRDELFIRCDDKEHIVREDSLENFTECNYKLNLSGVNIIGQAVYEKEWIDRRKNDSVE